MIEFSGLLDSERVDELGPAGVAYGLLNFGPHGGLAGILELSSFIGGQLGEYHAAFLLQLLLEDAVRYCSLVDAGAYAGLVGLVDGGLLVVGQGVVNVLVHEYEGNCEAVVGQRAVLLNFVELVVVDGGERVLLSVYEVGLQTAVELVDAERGNGSAQSGHSSYLILVVHGTDLEAGHVSRSVDLLVVVDDLSEADSEVAERLEAAYVCLELGHHVLTDLSGKDCTGILEVGEEERNVEFCESIGVGAEVTGGEVSYFECVGLASGNYCLSSACELSAEVGLDLDGAVGFLLNGLYPGVEASGHTGGVILELRFGNVGGQLKGDCLLFRRGVAAVVGRGVVSRGSACCESEAEGYYEYETDNFFHFNPPEKLV